MTGFRARVAVAAHDERGAVSVLVVGIAVALLVMAGLVVDGGNAINARQKISDDTEQAARAGANQIDLVELRTSGRVVVVEDQARAAAVSYLEHLGYDIGRIGVGFDAGEVVVSAEDTIGTQLLTFVGRTSFEVRGEASARPAVGIIDEVLP
ncbi:MAG: TadE/TadG family type IV pilus assembly protein [Jiangellaceae bacterium]